MGKFRRSTSVAAGVRSNDPNRAGTCYSTAAKVVQHCAPGMRITRLEPLAYLEQAGHLVEQRVRPDGTFDGWDGRDVLCHLAVYARVGRGGDAEHSGEALAHKCRTVWSGTDAGGTSSHGCRRDQ